MIPFEDYGGKGVELHFAHANAYPPGTYRALLTDIAIHFRVRAMHQRPLWTDSDPASFDTWEIAATDLVTFLDERNLANVIGAGHSLGAVATMMAAVRRPDLFRALVLIEPVFLHPDVLRALSVLEEHPLVAGALKRREEWADHQEAFEHFREKEVFTRWSDDALQDYVKSGMVKVPENEQLTLRFPREWEARIYALVPENVWSMLPMVTQPTLALRAAESETISAAAWQLWQEKQPHATFIELPGLGHLAPMESPQLVARMVVDYLASFGWRDQPPLARQDARNGS